MRFTAGAAIFRRTICAFISALGNATKIDKVEIHWPSGHTETLTNLAVDQHYSVLEANGIVSSERARPPLPRLP